MKKSVILLLAGVLLTGCYCKTDSPRGSWARGCDISWLSEMERDSVQFRDESLELRDCISLLRAEGMNAVRLRVWVNHSTGWSNKEDMIGLAKRAAKAGQRLMIDIHYSDFFADPNHQTIPAAWEEMDYEQMKEAVREHTLDVLKALKQEGLKPEWVQIGNETPNGMLWPMGKVDKAEGNWREYAAFTAIGYEAAKEVFPDITVIVHVDNAYERRDWFWESLTENGGKWDMIGLSHYPMMSAWNGGKRWQEMNELAEENIRRLIADWRCPVMIAEVGTFANDPTSAVVMADFMKRIQAIDSCAGIFYWEPQVYGGWRPQEYIPLGWGSYGMGAFTEEGQPNEALQIMLRPETKPVGSVLKDTINGVPCVVYIPFKVENQKSKVERYPVLYLQHGMWGNEFDWTEKGNLVGIMDYLLRAGKVKEMVVIMPDNCPGKPTYEEELANATTGEWEQQFAAFMAEAERKYPISNQPSQRAIAGLSMGGYHTMRVSSVLDGQFRYVGMFSAATFVHNMPSEPALLWVAIGKDDFLYHSFSDYRRWLEDNHREYTYYESAGGHDWPNWQDYISRFLPLCFQ